MFIHIMGESVIGIGIGTVYIIVIWYCLKSVNVSCNKGRCPIRYIDIAVFGK